MPVATKKQFSPRDEVVGGQHRVEVVAGVDGPLALVVVGGAEPALDDAAEALDRAGGDDALGGAADAEQQVDAGVGPGRHDGAGDVAVGDEPQPGAGVADLGGERLVPGPVEHDDGDVVGGLLLLALATRRMFSATGSRMSTTSAASGPVTSLSM